jgi:diacylglycerol kinase (ATP)
MSTRVSVVVNPRAGSGSAGQKLRGLRRGLDELGVRYEILETQKRGHATTLAARAIEGGCEVLAVMGGDGTLNEVCQVYVDAHGQPVQGPPIALFPSGTGGDFPKSHPFLRGGLAAALGRLSSNLRSPLDLGVITLHDIDGRPVRRGFVNVASVGISGAVDERVERGPKWLGGKAAFLIGTVGAALEYQNVDVEIDVDGREWHRGPMLLTAIANGQYLGGGMRIAPDADPADGLLDVITVGDLSRGKFLRLFPSVYKGAHIGLDSVRAGKGQVVHVRTTGAQKPILVDVDGETPGYLPLVARIFPGALQLIGG